MKPYDENDDINTIEQGGASGTSYTGASPENDVEEAKKNLEEHGFYQTLRGDWEKKE